MTETRAQAIERLKDNERHVIFADLAQTDQELLSSIGSENLQYLNGQLKWIPKTDIEIFVVGIYRIRPDYQPEPKKPKTDDYPIVKSGISLGVWRKDREAWLPLDFTPLHSLPSLPGFRGFWGTDGRDWTIDGVATEIAKGHKVVARFEVQE